MRMKDFYSDELIKTSIKRTNGLKSGHLWIDDTLTLMDELKNAPSHLDSLIDSIRKAETEKENKMIIQNAKAIINGKTYKVRDMSITHNAGEYPVANITVNLHPFDEIPPSVIMHKTGAVKAAPIIEKPAISKVIFNYPATIVFWSDNTKTVVKCKEGDQWDPHAGLSAAIAKKIFGSQINKLVKNAEYSKLPPDDEKKERH